MGSLEPMIGGMSRSNTGGLDPERPHVTRTALLRDPLGKRADTKVWRAGLGANLLLQLLSA